jgi:hypothetical protein
MKLVYVYLLVIILGCISLKNKYYDINFQEELSQYSYLLVGLRTVGGSLQASPMGTCFFVRNGNHLLFVSARHVISRYSAFNKKREFSQFDTIGIRYYLRNGGSQRFASISILELKRNLIQYLFYEKADLIVLNVVDSSLYQNVNTINKYMFQVLPENAQLDSVFSSGYGIEGNNSFTPESPQLFYKGALADNANIDASDPPNDKLYYLITPYALQGMSGSPVFKRYRSMQDGKLIIHFVFGGVLFGRNKSFNSSYVIPETTVIDSIKLFNFYQER